MGVGIAKGLPLAPLALGDGDAPQAARCMSTHATYKCALYQGDRYENDRVAG